MLPKHIPIPTSVRVSGISLVAAALIRACVRLGGRGVNPPVLLVVVVRQDHLVDSWDVAVLLIGACTTTGVLEAVLAVFAAGVWSGYGLPRGGSAVIAAAACWHRCGASLNRCSALTWWYTMHHILAKRILIVYVCVGIARGDA
jgi:hypothetical protein